MFRRIIVWVLPVITWHSLSAIAIDLAPGALLPMESGVNYFQAFTAQREFGERYAHGVRLGNVPGFDSTLYALRGGRYFELAEHPALFYMQASTGSIHPRNSNGDSGLGDAFACLTAWPYANKATGSYLGVIGYVIMPTGSYDNRRTFNMGENRYKSALQIGYQTRLC